MASTVVHRVLVVGDDRAVVLVGGCMKREKKFKAVKAWAGICEGKIDIWPSQAVGTEQYEIFVRRKDAARRYELFIPVLITPITKKKLKAKR